MKKSLFLLSITIMILALFVGCQEDSGINNIIKEEWNIPEGAFLVVIPEIEGVGETSSSRAITAGYKFEFAEGEALKVYSAVGGSLDAAITGSTPTAATSDPAKGNGQTATFTGAGFNLDPSAKYYSIYPAKASDAYSHTEDAGVHTTTIHRSFVGQTQTGNDSNAHLSGYDFNAANSTEKNGGVVFEYDRKVAFLTLKLTLPKALTPDYVYIRAVDGSLVTGITETIKSNEVDPTFTYTEASDLLINTTGTGSVETLTVHMVVGGGSSSAIRVGVVSGSEAYETVTSFSTGTFAANKHYTLSVNDKSVWGKFITDGASLKAGMEAGGAYILDCDITIDDSIFSDEWETSISIPGGKEVVLDLNGRVINLNGSYSFTLSDSESAKAKLHILDSYPTSSHLDSLSQYHGGIIYNGFTAITVQKGDLYMSGGSFVKCEESAISNGTMGGFLPTPGDGNRLNLSNVSFFECSSSSYGGSILNNGKGILAIKDCSFSNSSSLYYGGAVFSEGQADIVMTGCTFNGCATSNSGGAIHDNGSQRLELSNCTFIDCTVANTEGDINGGAVSSITPKYFKVTECTFTRCQVNATDYATPSGGAISIFEENSSGQEIIIQTSTFNTCLATEVRGTPIGNAICMECLAEGSAKMSVMFGTLTFTECGESDLVHLKGSNFMSITGSGNLPKEGKTVMK